MMDYLPEARTPVQGQKRSPAFSAGPNKGLPLRGPPYIEELDGKFNTLTFDMLPPKTMGEAPELVHLERERQEEECRDSSHPARLHHLQQIILIAGEGSHFASRRNPYGGKSNCRRVPPNEVSRVGPRRSERLAQRREMESTVQRIGIQYK
ncbi:hypothetical protein N7463_006382 [Penicillium fimorum]|uniref:Uncharacterized protein n=1 Tax=Penicillium fimorum TaxID=1882269 RepID=A0A9X0C608_9EURO|nr:hypothetical protein N7463_006382 [Penicillium fimorum]